MTERAREIQEEIDSIKSFDDVFRIIEKMYFKEAETFKVIIECYAGRRTKEETLEKIKELDPELYKKWEGEQNG